MDRLSERDARYALGLVAFCITAYCLMGWWGVGCVFIGCLLGAVQPWKF